MQCCGALQGARQLTALQIAPQSLMCSLLQTCFTSGLPHEWSWEALAEAWMRAKLLNPLLTVFRKPAAAISPTNGICSTGIHSCPFHVLCPSHCRQSAQSLPWLTLLLPPAGCWATTPRCARCSRTRSTTTRSWPTSRCHRTTRAPASTAARWRLLRRLPPHLVSPLVCPSSDRHQQTSVMHLQVTCIRCHALAELVPLAVQQAI